MDIFMLVGIAFGIGILFSLLGVYILIGVFLYHLMWEVREGGSISTIRKEEKP